MRAVLGHLAFLALLMLAFVLSLRRGELGDPDAYDTGRIVVKGALFLALAAADLTLLVLGPRRAGAGLRRFLQRHPRCTSALAGCAVTLVLLGCLEGAFWIGRRIWPGPAEVSDTFSGDWNQTDPLLGFRHLPSVAVDVTRVHRGDGRMMYRARYTIDADGHRVTPGCGEHPRRDVAFFGCSFTFGAGLGDGETIPARFAAAAADCSVVNFACCGYGTSHMLALLDAAAPAFLPQRALPPIAIYTFIDHHLMRNIGSLRVVDGAGAHFPCYVLGEDGRPLLRGNFHTVRPVRSLAYWLLGKSQILAAAGFDWPPAGDREALELTAALIAAARDRFHELTGSDRFALVLYPGCRLGPQLTARLQRADVHVLDYAGLFDPRAEGLELPDGHPSARAARIVGERLAHDIGPMLH